MTDELPYTEEYNELSELDYYEEEVIREVYPDFRADEILEGMEVDI